MSNKGQPGERWQSERQQIAFKQLREILPYFDRKGWLKALQAPYEFFRQRIEEVELNILRHERFNRKKGDGGHYIPQHAQTKIDELFVRKLELEQQQSLFVALVAFIRAFDLDPVEDFLAESMTQAESHLRMEVDAGRG